MENNESKAQPVRKIVANLEEQSRHGHLDRREFLSLASVYGVSSAMAYGLLGLSTPALAEDSSPKKGGILKLAMRVADISDPRLYDWPEKGNVARLFLETLVTWDFDYTFRPTLLEGWDVSDDAKTYILKVRQGVKWNNGDVFDVDDVIFNFTRWCDKKAEGNSMASRMATLIDTDTQKLRAGIIERVDDYTLKLKLPEADITLIPAISEFPALIVHRSFKYSDNIADVPIGTGPFELESLEIGTKATARRRTNGTWWGGEVFLDGVEFIDYGTDPSAMVAGFESDDIQANDESSAEYIPILDSIGLEHASAVTAATIVMRMNVNQEPYTDQRVRNAVQLCVDNSIVMELGIDNRGQLAENHHVGPMHPEYNALAPIVRNPARALALLDEAGHRDTELELISVDNDWQKNSSDAVAAQLRDAGVNIKRTLYPGATFWNDWTKYPFSATSWGARPLGVQVLALAYRSGEAWNESGFSNSEFDEVLNEALGVTDAEKRQALMLRLQTILQDSGVIIQPFWRGVTMHHTANVHGLRRHQTRDIDLTTVWLDS